MKVRIEGDGIDPRNFKVVNDETGELLHVAAVQVQIDESGVDCNLIMQAVKLDVKGKARVMLLDPEAGKMKQIRRIEFADGTAFEVPEAPTIALVRDIPRNLK